MRIFKPVQTLWHYLFLSNSRSRVSEHSDSFGEALTPFPENFAQQHHNIYCDSAGRIEVSSDELTMVAEKYKAYISSIESW